CILVDGINKLTLWCSASKVWINPRCRSQTSSIKDNSPVLGLSGPFMNEIMASMPALSPFIFQLPPTKNFLWSDILRSARSRDIAGSVWSSGTRCVVCAGRECKLQGVLTFPEISGIIFALAVDVIDATNGEGLAKCYDVFTEMNKSKRNHSATLKGPAQHATEGLTQGMVCLTYHKNNRINEDPAHLPEHRGSVTQHEFEVLTEAPDSIHPVKGNQLKNGNKQHTNTASKTINQSSPSVKSMKKKRTDHSCGIGSVLEIASGSFQPDTNNQQCNENDIWESGSEIHHFA
ncbi:hypothetical protein Hamer_G017151, partial [Homarus americanus]